MDLKLIVTHPFLGLLRAICVAGQISVDMNVTIAGLRLFPALEWIYC